MSKVVFRSFLLPTHANDSQKTAAMLEERWRQTVARRPDALAVCDGASGRCWTFAELAAAADAGGVGDAGAERGYVSAVGRGVGFLIEVLRAWRACVPLCPLEPGQAAPVMPPPPPGMAHIKLTSGSTGVARVVLLTAAQMAADADYFCNVLAALSVPPPAQLLTLRALAGKSAEEMPGALQEAQRAGELDAAAAEALTRMRAAMGV